MEPCQQGYPCKYAQCGTCVQPQCWIVRDGDTVTDILTGEKHDWVTRQLRKPRRELTDERYDEFLNRFELRKLMESADTYERRNGAVRPIRHAGG